MKTVLLSLFLALASLAAHAQPFTNGISPFCHVYRIPNGTIEYYCYNMLVTYQDGTTGGLAFTAYFAANGTFSGSIYKDGNLFAGDFSGTFTGSQTLPTSLTGAFTGGSITVENFGLARGPCYKGTCQHSPYVTDGAGQFN